MAFSMAGKGGSPDSCSFLEHSIIGNHNKIAIRNAGVTGFPSRILVSVFSRAMPKRGLTG